MKRDPLLSLSIEAERQPGSSGRWWSLGDSVPKSPPTRLNTTAASDRTSLPAHTYITPASPSRVGIRITAAVIQQPLINRKASVCATPEHSPSAFARYTDRRLYALGPGPTRSPSRGQDGSTMKSVTLLHNPPPPAVPGLMRADPNPYNRASASSDGPSSPLVYANRASSSARLRPR